MDKDALAAVKGGEEEAVEDISNTNLKLGSSDDDDIALKIVGDAALTILSPKQSKHVARKIDLILMPLLMVTFMLQYVDKILLTGASQFGIIEDLHLYKVEGVDSKTHEPILSLHQ